MGRASRTVVGIPEFTYRGRKPVRVRVVVEMPVRIDPKTAARIVRDAKILAASAAGVKQLAIGMECGLHQSRIARIIASHRQRIRRP